MKDGGLVTGAVIFLAVAVFVILQVLVVQMAEVEDRCEGLGGIWRDGKYDTEICEREGAKRICQTWRIRYPAGCYKPGVGKMELLERPL